MVNFQRILYFNILPTLPMLTSLDILYMVLALGIALMSIFISVLLVYAIFILRDINKATEAVKDSAMLVNEFIVKPIRIGHEILKYARPVVDVVEQHMNKEKKSKDKKRKE